MFISWGIAVYVCKLPLMFFKVTGCSVYKVNMPLVELSNCKHFTDEHNLLAVYFQCSAVQCSAVQCSAVQCSAVQCSAV